MMEMNDGNEMMEMNNGNGEMENNGKNEEWKLLSLQKETQSTTTYRIRNPPTLVEVGDLLLGGVWARDGDLDRIVFVEVDARVAAAFEEQLVVGLLPPFRDVGHRRRLPVEPCELPGAVIKSSLSMY